MAAPTCVRGPQGQLRMVRYDRHFHLGSSRWYVLESEKTTDGQRWGYIGDLGTKHEALKYARTFRQGGE